MAKVKAMEDQIKIFFELLDGIDRDIEDARKDADVFDRNTKYYSSGYHMECDGTKCKPYKKNPLLHTVTMSHHHCTAPHNVKGTSVILWYDGANGRQMSFNEFVENSEKLKIVHEWEHYQFVLIRTASMFAMPTETIWSTHFSYRSRETHFTHDLALIDTRTNSIVHQTPRRWEFEQQCLNQNKADEYIENVHDVFTQFEPFKMFFTNLDDVDINYIHDAWHFWIDQPTLPTDEHGSYLGLIKTDPKHRFSNNKSSWYLCTMIGRKTSSNYGSHRDKNTTWFYVYSPNGVPTKSTALRQVMDFIEYYDHDSTIDLFEVYKRDNVQLNNIPLECAERMRYGATKLRCALKDIFGWDWSTIVQKYDEAKNSIKDDYNKKEYIKVITFKR